MNTKISLRVKNLKGEKQSFYLDYYPAVQHPVTRELTRREFLGLYLDNSNPTNLSLSTQNTETRKVAEKIRVLRNKHFNNPNNSGKSKKAIQKSIDQLITDYLYRYPDSKRKKTRGINYSTSPENMRKSFKELQIKQILTIEEACELLSVSRWTVHRAIKRKELPVGKLGRTVLIKRSDIDKLFNSSE